MPDGTQIASAYVELTARGLNKIDGQLKTASRSTRATARLMEREFRVADRGSLKLSQSLAGMVNPLTLIAGAAASAGMALGAMAKKGVELAAGLESSMANVATLVDTTKVNIQGMSDAVLDMTTAVNKSSADLAQGLYQVISAGVDSGQALRVLEVSARAATAGLSSTETAVDGITSVLNAYGMEAEEATRVGDVMFKAVEQGKLTFDDIAGSLGRVIPLAAAMGVEFEDVVSTTTALTLSGLSYAEAVTGIRQTLVALNKPSSDAQKAARELGIQFDGAALKGQGLIGFLDNLKDATQGQQEVLSRLFGDVEGLNAVLALTGKNAEKVLDISNQIGNAQGAASRAFDKQQSTFSAALNSLKLEMSKLLTEIGQVFVPALTKLITEVSKLTKETTDTLFPSEEVKSISQPYSPGYLRSAERVGKEQLYELLPTKTVRQDLIDSARGTAEAFKQAQSSAEAFDGAVRKMTLKAAVEGGTAQQKLSVVRIPGVPMGQYTLPPEPARARIAKMSTPTVTQPRLMPTYTGRRATPVSLPQIEQPELRQAIPTPMSDVLIEQPEAVASAFGEARQASAAAADALDEMRKNAADAGKELESSAMKFSLSAELGQFAAASMPQGQAGDVAAGAIQGGMIGGPTGAIVGAVEGLLSSMPEFATLMENITRALQPVLDLVTQILAPALTVLSKIMEGVAWAMAELVNAIVSVINAILGIIDKIPLVNVGRLKRVTLPDAVDASSSTQQAGGVHISEITGGTRDILVDLLRPLATLDALPGLFEGMRQDIRAMRDAIEARFDAPGGGGVHIDTLNVQAASVDEAQDFNDWLGAQLREDRLLLGVPA